MTTAQLNTRPDQASRTAQAHLGRRHGPLAPPCPACQHLHLQVPFSAPPCCEASVRLCTQMRHAPSRLAGSARSKRLITSAAAAATLDGTRILPEAIRSKVKYSEAARKGALPTSI